MRGWSSVSSLIAAADVLARMTLDRLATGLVYNPTAPANLRDPYPMYARFRARDPVHRSRLLRVWALFRYADVAAALRDPRLSVSQRTSLGFEDNRRREVAAGVLDVEDPLQESLLRMDPPDHTRLRALVNKAFTPRSVETLRPRIARLVGELLDAVHGDGAVDLIETLAYPLPVIVIAEMIGVPAEDRARFKHWSDEIVRGMGFVSREDTHRGRVAGMELRAYFEGIAVERRRRPGDDLLSALLAAEEEGGKLTSSEVFTTLNLLLFAGNETTTYLITNGLLALLRHPDQLALLRDRPDLMPGAIEELLRFDSPVQATTRFAREDVELSGHTIRRGEQIVLSIGAANRDAAQFEAPDRVDVTRRDNRHLAFGLGAHYCLGAPLARMEAQVALGALIERYPRLRLAADDLSWRRNVILRGPTTLPVHLG